MSGPVQACAKAYRVEPVEPACGSCGASKGFDVVGPDGVCISMSFDDEGDAEDMAEQLNRAYEQGCAAAAKEGRS